jgi:Icc-related predicted phosphoesterase
VTDRAVAGERQASDSTKSTVRVAAVGDLHCDRDGQGTLQALFTSATAECDVLLLCGDLVDHGTPEEARVLAREIATAVGVPTFAVLGNHDFECGKVDELIAILTDVGVRVLDGDAVEVAGIGIAGVKGFAGGFGRYTLGSWGEPTIKQFVHETVEEALKLESALSQLRTTTRLAMLHYAPIKATVEGEAPEIFPFLGCSRLEEPLNRYAVSAVVHGHAHAGAAEGRTAANIPVYNVAVPVLRRAAPERPAYRLLELPAGTGIAEPAAEKDNPPAPTRRVIEAVR